MKDLTWPSFYGGMARRGYQDVDTPASPRNVKWQVEVPHGVSQGEISIGTGNRIYFKTNGETDGSYVFCPDGGAVNSRLKFANDTVYGSAGNNTVFALNAADGSTVFGLVRAGHIAQGFTARPLRPASAA